MSIRRLFRAFVATSYYFFRFQSLQDIISDQQANGVVNFGELNAFEVRILVYILLLRDAVLTDCGCGVEKTVGSSTKFCSSRLNTGNICTLSCCSASPRLSLRGFVHHRQSTSP